MRFNRKQITMALGVLALIAIAIYVACRPAKAGEHDQNYYQRTGTAPQIEGHFLLGPKVNYTDKLGVAGVFGYQWEDVGVTLLGEIGAVQLKGSSGTTEFRRFCQTYKVPYSVGDRTQAEVGVSVLFKLHKKPPR